MLKALRSTRRRPPFAREVRLEGGWWGGGWRSREKLRDAAVEDDARHSRQHLEDETTDRKDVAAEARAPAAWSREIGGFGLPASHHTEGKFD